jgi:hypothetical protein
MPTINLHSSFGLLRKSSKHKIQNNQSNQNCFLIKFKTRRSSLHAQNPIITCSIVKIQNVGFEKLVFCKSGDN